MKFTTHFLILVFISLAGNLALSQTTMSTCPRLEGINLKCMTLSPPGPPPSGGQVNCPVSTRSIACNSASGTGTITRATSRSVCTSYTCEVTNSPEGLPRYRSQCGQTSTCCEVQTITCYTGRMTTEGTATTNADCSVSISCPNGSGADGPDCDSGSSGGPTDCGSSGGGSCDGIEAPGNGGNCGP